MWCPMLSTLPLQAITLLLRVVSAVLHRWGNLPRRGPASQVPHAKLPVHFGCVRQCCRKYNHRPCAQRDEQKLLHFHQTKRVFDDWAREQFHLYRHGDICQRNRSPGMSTTGASTPLVLPCVLHGCEIQYSTLRIRRSSNRFLHRAPNVHRSRGRGRLLVWLLIPLVAEEESVRQ